MQPHANVGDCAGDYVADGINRLTALKVTKLSNPGHRADGEGLHLCVKNSSVKSWIFRYRFGKKEHEIGLGSLETFTLADARERALSQRKLLADGKDPLGLKRSVQLECSVIEVSIITFDSAASRYIASHNHGWKNETHEQQWSKTLATYASPVFGNRLESPPHMRAKSLNTP
jgi:hypothetical protein